MPLPGQRRSPEERAQDLLEYYRDIILELGFDADPLPAPRIPARIEPGARVLHSIEQPYADQGEREYGFFFGIDVPRRVAGTRRDTWELFARYDEDTDNVDVFLQEHGGGVKGGPIPIRNEDELVRWLEKSLGRL